MQIFLQLAVDIISPFLAFTLVLCLADWLAIMFKRAFNG